MTCDNAPEGSRAGTSGAPAPSAGPAVSTIRRSDASLTATLRGGQA